MRFPEAGAVTSLTIAQPRNEARGFRFQPIVRLQDLNPVGHELLAGSATCPTHTPAEWREWYERVPGIVAEHAPEGLVFINVDAQSISTEPSVLAALAHARHLLEGLLIVEWIEAGWLDVGCAAILALKTLGFRIAVDDVGDGADGIGRVSAVGPEFAKISHSLFHRLRGTGAEALRHLRQLLEGLRCEVILEGIETRSDLDLALKAGFELGQGWLFPALSWGASGQQAAARIGAKP